MNIWFITSHLGDGAGQAIAGMAILCNKVEYKNSVVLLQEPKKKKHVNRCIREGVDVIHISGKDAVFGPADVIVLNWWGNADIELFLEEVSDCQAPKVLWIHKNGLYDPPLKDEILRKVDALFVTSPFSLTKWKDATLVYGFGDFDVSSYQIKSEYGCSDNCFKIGYVGSPSYKKLPINVIDYFQKTKEIVPNACFYLAGETTEEFRRDIFDAGLSNHVKFLGWILDVNGMLYSMDAFGYLLRPDTFATTENAVLEAMAIGLPVVMSREPLGKYIIGDDGGILIDSPYEFAFAIKRLSESVEYREMVGKTGRARVEREYNAQDNLERFLDACKMAIVNKHGEINK